LGQNETYILYFLPPSLPPPVQKTFPRHCYSTIFLSIYYSIWQICNNTGTIFAGTTSASTQKNPKKLSQKELHSWRKQLTSTVEKLQKEIERKDARIAE